MSVLNKLEYLDFDLWRWNINEHEGQAYDEMKDHKGIRGFKSLWECKIVQENNGANTQKDAVS